MLSMMAFTPHAFSQELNGCWKSEHTGNSLIEKICFSDTAIKTDSNMLLKIEDKKIDGDNITIKYSIHNTRNTAKIQFLEKDKIHLTLPQSKNVFTREAD
ncbi:hypothetical protein [uncultured Desulfovibrio sp.]|uniref:hypothetical protein n=1 Tax=uncultured Desulfovibrio sp. TaxID=167968 RepID=UPI0026384A0A|nr:hypothetical protein [uncultured Desulfovibrio sp.]